MYLSMNNVNITIILILNENITSHFKKSSVKIEIFLVTLKNCFKLLSVWQEEEHHSITQRVKISEFWFFKFFKFKICIFSDRTTEGKIHLVQLTRITMPSPMLPIIPMEKLGKNWKDPYKISYDYVK